MSRLGKGSRPTRAERKAEKRAAKDAAKEAAFDAREMAKEEKRAAKAANSRWGRRKREAAEADELFHASDEFEHGESASGFGALSSSQLPSDSGPDEIFHDPDPQPAMRAPRKARRLGGDRSQPLHQDRPNFDEPAPLQPFASGPGGFVPHHEPLPEPEPRRRSLGMRLLGRKSSPEPDQEPRSDPALSPMREGGTQIRPAQSSHAPLQLDTELAPLAPAAGPLPAETFASLRRAVKAPGGKGGRSSKIDLNNVLVLDDPVIEPDDAAIEPLRPDFRSGSVAPQDVASMAAVSRVEHQPTRAPAYGFSENWLGLWVSEDGEAIFIEEDNDGWFAVTVLPDPTTTCYAGPDYPEIQSYRMPASYTHEAVGEFDGERLTVITVPGLPDTHRSPMMYIYFLTSVPAADGGGNRFATPDDPGRRVFIAADFELGTVNPWSDRDDIEWIDPSVNYYKAPGKLDAYMMRRMAKDDPLN